MRKYQVRFRGGITEKEHSYLAGILPDTNDGRKLALDQRLMNEMLPDEPESKVNRCVDNAFKVWEESALDRGTQLIFCDLSTPKADGTFNVYDDVREKLVARGVPREEVAFMQTKKSAFRSTWARARP